MTEAACNSTPSGTRKIHAQDAIGLLAFGELLSLTDLLAASNPKPTREWGAPFHLKPLLAALSARAKGEVWRLGGKSEWGAWKLRAQARRLMRTTGLSAETLAAELEGDLFREAEVGRRIAAARAQLVDAARCEKIGFHGRRGNYWLKEMADKHESVPATDFLRADITVTEDGWATIDPGKTTEGLVSRRSSSFPDWGDLYVRLSQVIALLPEHMRGLPVEVASPTEPGSVPAPAKVLVDGAARNIARDLLVNRGQPPTQREVIAVLRAEGFLPTESRFAAANLPSDLRRGRGEHDRKLAADKRGKFPRDSAGVPKA
ncbi:hypothetical protein ACLF3G_24005 [Falsiroseomonas sp. HC035]|uniref:hypothetical protein n=1 Tax=Falsiroseomonas sp. HC035 TaxID=3390999 RepID=UPI003D3104D5